MIGDVLKRLRKEKGLTQEQLAEKVGLSKSAIIQYENNKREPNFHSAFKLCDFFNVTMPYLTGKTEYKKASEDIFFNSSSRIAEKLKDNPDVLRMVISIYMHFIDFIDKLISDEYPLDDKAKSEYSIQDYIKLSVFQSIIDNVSSTYFLKYKSFNSSYDTKVSELDFYKKLEKEFKIKLDRLEEDLYEVFSIRSKELYSDYCPINDSDKKRETQNTDDLYQHINPDRYYFSKFIKEFIESKRSK
jgi:transcriptional regulator with XRE-family HTH domain